MDITIEQALTFDAVEREGTIQKAAKSLNKSHSTVMYLLKSLENQTQLSLFDRSGYRNQVSLEGEIVLKYCRQLITTRNELKQICTKLQGDWEPSLKLIYDDVVDFNLIGDALYKLNEFQTPTEVKVLSAHLHDVEKNFKDQNADIMVTILPINQPDIFSIKLQPIKMFLVAHKKHSLTHQKKLSFDTMNKHTFIKIKNTATKLGLSTDNIKFNSSFLVNDFATKKQAISKGLGFGWLPEYSVEKELKNNSIQVLDTIIKNEHILFPKLYHRKEEFMGRTTKQLIKDFDKQ